MARNGKDLKGRETDEYNVELFGSIRTNDALVCFGFLLLNKTGNHGMVKLECFGLKQCATSPPTRIRYVWVIDRTVRDPEKRDRAGKIDSRIQLVNTPGSC